MSILNALNTIYSIGSAVIVVTHQKATNNWFHLKITPFN